MSRSQLPLGYDFAQPSPTLAGYWRAYVPNVGTFYIRRVAGLWHAMFGDESLGSYSNPADAHRALISGCTARPASGVDPSQLRLPADLSEWPFYAGAAQLKPSDRTPHGGPVSKATWHFHRDGEASSFKWTWRRLRIDGSIEQISEAHVEFGKVMANAVENGFRPRNDAYVVIAGGTYTHFRPGERPVTIPHDSASRPPTIPDSRQAADSAKNDSAGAEGPVKPGGKDAP